MNQEEEIPTRVTRGALRRRSIDQDATPQNPAATGTNAAGGTPKKAASTAKKGSAMVAIPESQIRSSTPVGVGSRISRRRMSETIDTPTAASNKLVQQLKNSETLPGSGRLSCNTSLTEENVQELNAANEGNTTTTRTRTPARLRASQETVASTTPQTVPVATRRSTRRNSVTSDDGSVQSLPITTPRTPVLRSFKDEIIVEEDSDDRAESAISDASLRTTRKANAKSPSQSPRNEAASPLSNMRKGMTPPLGSNSPNHSSPSRKLSNTTPLSKNVSADDSAEADNQSSYPKSPSSLNKKIVLVGVNDLRNSRMINGVPKINAEIDLNGSAVKVKDAQQEVGKEPPLTPNGVADVIIETEVKQNKNSETGPPSPAEAKSNTVEPKAGSVSKATTSSILAAESSLVIASNDVSGIEELGSSIIQEMETSTGKMNNSQIVDEKIKKMPKFWSPKARGTSDKGIDPFIVSEQKGEQVEDEEKQLSASQMYPRTEKKEENDEQVSDAEEEENVESDSGRSGNELIDDEAMEVDGYQSGDSLDSEMRREMEMNEIVEDGESIGSEDTVEDEEDDLDVDDDNDSFLASDDEDALLQEEEESRTEKTPSPRRIGQMEDDRMECPMEKGKNATMTSDVDSPSRSRNNTSNNRSVSVNKNSSPEREADRSVIGSDVSNTPEKLCVSPKIRFVKVGTPKDDKSTVNNEEVGSKNQSPKVTEDSAEMSPPSSRTVLEKDNECDGTVLEASQQDQSLENSTDRDEESTKMSETRVTEGGSFAENKRYIKGVTSSRKSLPPNSATVELESGGNPVPRKSLPASVKMRFVEEEVSTEDLQPSSSNLEASYQEEDEESEQKEEVQRDNKTHITGKDQKEQAVENDSDEEYYEAVWRDGGDVEPAKPAKLIASEPSPDRNEGQPTTERQVTVPAKPARKSLPAASLISAQFYLGGSKNEKRATITAGETVAMGTTSTPNQRQSAKKKNAVQTLVANPFALGTAKAKARLSMGAVAAPGQGEQHQTPKKSRNSLPVMLDEEVSEALDMKSTGQGTKASPNHNQQQHDEPEPMEVDEYEEVVEVEEKGGETEHDDAALHGEREVGEVRSKSKTPKKNPKALEDFDLESILFRCNEVVRADKERKKQNATFLQQKRDEKRRLRQLREQHQKQESADANETQQRDANEDDVGDNGGADTAQNSTISSTANDSVEQDMNSAKKKNKKKKKLKNYVLEELAEAKKDRVALAVQRKLEMVELRKQRKKERREASLKLLNKENGDLGTVSGSASEGIGAKLLKAKKKKKQRQKETETAAAAAADNNAPAAEQNKQPAVRVALSAFAVFRELQNNHSPKPAGSVTLGAKNKSPVGVPKGVEQQHPEQLKGLIPGEPKKVAAQYKDQPEATKYAEEPANGVKQVDKQVKEIQRPQKKDALEKTVSADDVIAPRKKSDDKNKLPLQKSATESQLPQKVKPEKPKRKLDGAKIRAEAAADGPETEPIPKARKQKKNKREDTPVLETPAVASPTNGVYESATKQKKGHKNGAMLPSAARDTEPNRLETVVASALREVRAAFDFAVEQKKKGKKAPKKQAVQQEEGAFEGGVSSAPEDRAALNYAVEQKKKGRKPPKEEVAALEKEVFSSPAVAGAGPPKKRKRDPIDGNSSATSITPRPTKLRALQRADHGFVEETVTPEKSRLKRNFGFAELQATPKAVGFKVSSLLPTEELHLLAAAGGTKGRSKSGQAVASAEPSRTLPLPVWTSSGYFLVTPDAKEDRTKGDRTKKSALEGHKKKSKTAGGGGDSGYVPLKGQRGFKLKTLRSVDGSGSSSSAVMAKPNRIDPDTIGQSVVSFRRQQLLEKTAHLREKKKGGRV